MKCVMYISRVVTQKNGAAVPSGLSEIYMRARKFNAHHNVTGVLSFKNGYYLQILEGGSDEVNQLYRNIKSDSRHNYISTLLEANISQRSFPNKSMRLVTLAQSDTEIKKFITENIEIISDLEEKELRLLRIFYDVSILHLDASKSQYIAKYVTLVSWPDFNLVEQTPAIIELSARLTSGLHAYDSLVDSGEFGTQNELDNILREFNSLGILRVSDTSEDINPPRNAITPNGFYSKMKNFLRLG